MLLRRELAAPGANLVLRRDRQLIDPRHAQGALRQAFRLRRNKRFRLVRLLACRRIDKQRRLGTERTDGDVLSHALRQQGRGDRSLSRFDRGVDGSRRRSDCGGERPGRLRSFDAFRQALVVGTQPLRDLRDPRLRRRHCRPLRQGIVDPGRDHRNADDAVEALVEGRADDDIGILVDLAADPRCRFVDFVEREVAAAGDGDEQALGALHRGVVDQRIGDRRLGGG